MKWSILVLIAILSQVCLGRKTLQDIPDVPEQLGSQFFNPGLIVGAGCCGVNPDNLDGENMFEKSGLAYLQFPKLTNKPSSFAPYTNTACCAQNPFGECCTSSPPALCIEQAQSSSGRIDGNTWIQCCYSKATQFFPRYDPSCPPPQCALIGADPRNYIICCSLKCAGQDATCPQPAPAPAPPPTPIPSPTPTTPIPVPSPVSPPPISPPPEDESPCPSVCSDMPPNSSYTCMQQVEFKKCEETWMVGKCDWSCGRCSCELAPAPEIEN